MPVVEGPLLLWLSSVSKGKRKGFFSGLLLPENDLGKENLCTGLESIVKGSLKDVDKGLLLKEE